LSLIIWATVANRGLTAHEVRENWLWILILTSFAAWSLWRIVVAFERRTEPMRHPIAQRLAAYGDITRQARALDHGIGESGGGVQFLNAVLAPGFLVHRSRFDTIVLPTSGILWVYQKVTSKSVNFIPVGTNYDVVLWGAKGEELELTSSQAGVDRAIRQIAEVAPGVIVGYDATLKSLMRDASARREVEELVRTRRKAVGAAAPRSRAS
jgi:hypothetical protein